MKDHTIDLANWERAAQFRFFRSFERPHYTVTTRLDVSRLMAARAGRGLSPYRATLWAVGAGCDAVPALRTRFADETVTVHAAVDLSMSVPRPDRSFGYGYLPWSADLATYDREAAALIAAVAASADLGANDGRTDVVYVSALPWIDVYGLTNAMPRPDDSIPRVAWGRIVEEDGRHRMGITAEVHHAVVDGAHLGAFFEAVQAALDRV